MRTRTNRHPWRRRAAAAALLLALGGTVGYVAADPFSTPEGVPRLVTYEGHLTQNGAPVPDGTRNLRFELFAVPNGGAAVWSSVRSVQVSGGHFAVTLGDTANGQPAIDLADFVGGDLYLEAAVEVAASSFEVLGRQRVTSVPYALRAATAHTASTADTATRVVENTYVNTTTSRSISLDAVVCGESAPTTGNVSFGGRTGYAGIKALCESACGSATAHGCTPEEVVRHLATGGTLAAGEKRVPSGTQAFSGNGQAISDCDGFRSADPTMMSSAFSQLYPSRANCDLSLPYLCCD